MLALDIGLNFDTLAIVILVAIVVIVAGLYLWWGGWVFFRKPLTGRESLLGKQGRAVTDLSREKDGEVSVEGIIWNARLHDDSETATIPKGDPVVVAEVSSLTLLVKPLKNAS